jgi:divalent metal cation (Fe/Co/Zn/Cd) transporter
MLAKLRTIVSTTPGVDAVNRLAATYAGTSAVWVDADLDLDEDLDTAEIEALLDLIEQRVRDIVPATQRVRVELNSPAQPTR